MQALMESESKQDPLEDWLHRHRQWPVLGGLSVFAVLCAVLLSWVNLTAVGGSGEQGFWSFMGWVNMTCFMFIPSVFLGVASLVRRERPRWLAIVGLSLGGVPAAGGVYMFLAEAL